ncbi:MAG: GtrA family protein [Cyclobacteriaceae bacterium]
MNKLLSNRLIKFGIAGGISAILETIMLVVLVEKVGLEYLTSNAIAFIFTNIFNYLLSRYWVFESSYEKYGEEIILFYIIVGVGLLINQFIMFVLVEHIMLDYKLSKLVAIAVTVLWNYFGKKKLVFKVK